MNHRHTWTKLAGIGLLAIGLAGCGGGGSSADPVADSAGGSAVVADSQTVVVNKSFTAAQFQGTKITPVVVPGIIYGAGDREGRASQAGLSLQSGNAPHAH